MLTLEQIRTITTGALTIWEENGYFRFSRFRPEHLQEMRKVTYENYDEDTCRGFDERCLSTAGIRMEFTTRGGELSFDYLVPAGGEEHYFSVDIQIDGMGVYHLYKTDFPHSDTIRLEIPATAEPCRVTVFFPVLALFAIRNVCLPEDFAPACRKLKYLALGDSITQGAIANHPSQTYAGLLADMLDAEILNQAIAGVQFNPVYLDEKSPFQPDIVTCASGVNDWGARAIYGCDNPRAYLEKVVNTFPNAKIFVILPTWVADEATSLRGGYSVEDVRQEITRVASQFPQLTVLDSRRFVPHVIEYFADQRMHPNDMGFMHYAYNLYNALKPYL